MAVLLEWDKVGERFYETGVSKGVLYPAVSGAYPKGYAWNGLISVTQSPSGAESNAFYADNIKYLNLMSNEEFGATIEAYYYPPEFAPCNGEASLAKGVTIGQQTRQPFGMSYVTNKGNDTQGNEYGYIIHLIYGALASPSEKAYETINDTPNAITFSWEISTTPVTVPGFKPSAYIEIDSTTCTPSELQALEAILYGTAPTGSGTEGQVEARLPLPSELAEIFTTAAE